MRLLTDVACCHRLLLRCCYGCCRWLRLQFESLLLKERCCLELVAFHHIWSVAEEVLPALTKSAQLSLSLPQFFCQKHMHSQDFPGKAGDDKCKEFTIPAVRCCVSCWLDLNRTPQVSWYTACSVKPLEMILPQHMYYYSAKTATTQHTAGSQHRTRVERKA